MRKVWEANRGAGRVLVAAGVALVCGGASGQGVWTAPPGGGVEMFRRGDRVFTVGPDSGGAGRGAVSGPLAAAKQWPPGWAGQAAAVSREKAEGLELVQRLAPTLSWDAPEGPTGATIADGTLYFYRVGTYRPEVVARAGEPVLLPPGEWLWVGEAPGFVSTFTSRLPAPRGRTVQLELVSPMVPACRLELVPAERWADLERIDIVSLSEAVVYPMSTEWPHPGWIPAGDYLAYGIDREGELSGMTRRQSCKAGETVRLSPPAEPAGDRQGLIVRWDLAVQSREEALRAVRKTTAMGAGAEPRAPDALFHHGRTIFSFYVDLPTGRIELRPGSGPAMSLAELDGEGGRVYFAVQTLDSSLTSSVR